MIGSISPLQHSLCKSASRSIFYRFTHSCEHAKVMNTRIHQCRTRSMLTLVHFAPWTKFRDSKSSLMSSLATLVRQLMVHEFRGMRRTSCSHHCVNLLVTLWVHADHINALTVHLLAACVLVQVQISLRRMRCQARQRTQLDPRMCAICGGMCRVRYYRSQVRRCAHLTLS